MPRPPRVSARELARALEKQGFVLSRSKGSHRIYRHPDTSKRVTVPYHEGRPVATCACRRSPHPAYWEPHSSSWRSSASPNSESHLMQSHCSVWGRRRRAKPLNRQFHYRERKQQPPR